MSEHVIYRCGWCGRPTDKDGVVLQGDPDEYMAEHQDALTIKVNGECCPNGDEGAAPWFDIPEEDLG